MRLRGGTLETDVDINNRAYIEMKKELDKFKGKYVIFAHGRFIGAFDKIEDVKVALSSIKPRPNHAIVLKVGHDTKIRRRLEWWGGSIKLESA